MKTNIFFQNGMDNDFKSASASADLISKDNTVNVGLIVNSTKGIHNDVIEYLPNNLYLKDALNGEVYQQIANNKNNDKNLIIAHSAGNEDIVKAAKVLKLQNVNLNNKIDFISVGSPVSAKKLQQLLQPIGANLIGQYNNWLDPVTNSKTWAVGAITLAVGVGATKAGSGLEAFARGLVGGGVGGAAIIGGLKTYHPFSTYYNKNYKNLSNDIKDWIDKNRADNN